MPKRILVITEKPSSASRIANALDEESKPTRMTNRRVTYYSARNGDAELIIVSALGHLYTISQVGEGWTYPIFDFKWVPVYQQDKSKKHTKRYVEAIKELGEEASEYVSACDYDIEGSLIAFNILRYALGEQTLSKSKRMFFNTLTDEDLRKAWSNLSDSLDYPTIASGKARHEIDWLYGINLSRALTESTKRFGDRRTLSIGRVQGPTLRFVKEREAEIRSFVPTPFWNVKAETIIDEVTYRLQYRNQPVKRELQAKNIRKKCAGKEGLVKKIIETIEIVVPPTPFNLSDLQKEAYRIYKIKPSKTLDLAEKLYLSAHISYPRTDSQRLPPTIDFRDILTRLCNDDKYVEYAKVLLSKETILPIQGKKDDQAHPAIHPTGKTSRKMPVQNYQVFDLIVRRFMASMSEPALKKKTEVVIDVNGEIFTLSLEEYENQGWRIIYPFHQLREFPPIGNLQVGMTIPIQRLSTRRQYTKPARRFDAISLLRLMETHRIGTKATRTSIIDTLSKRGYTYGEKLVLTNLGQSVASAIEIYCPEIMSVAFTRNLESRLERLQSGEKSYDSLITEAIAALNPTLMRIKENERMIGEEILDSDNDAKISEKRCMICQRSRAADSVYCERHQSAYTNIEENYPKWRIALGLNWETYLRKLMNVSVTGSWVKEVVDDILGRT